MIRIRDKFRDKFIDKFNEHQQIREIEMVEELKPQFAEDEELERAKTWWKNNGRSIVGGVVIGLAGVVGFNGWTVHQKSQGENASVLYQSLLNASEDASVDAIADDLVSNYTDTPYSTNAALLMAKKTYEAGETESAIKHLNWVLDNSKDQAFLHMARIRLASIFIENDEMEQASELLLNQEWGSFATRYNELLGDINLANGDINSAREYYTASLENLTQQSSGRQLLQLKLDNLGG